MACGAKEGDADAEGGAPKEGDGFSRTDAGGRGRRCLSSHSAGKASLTHDQQLEVGAGSKAWKFRLLLRSRRRSSASFAWTSPEKNVP